MHTPSFSYTCSKHFSDFPCAHRQWRHPGHCRFVHGYSRSFCFWFAAEKLDQFGFVVDFASLNSLYERLKDQFDHTFLVNSDDPLLSQWKNLHAEEALDLRVMDNVGMESSAKLVWEWANELLLDRDYGRTCCWRAEAFENSANSASFQQVPAWFKQQSPEL